MKNKYLLFFTVWLLFFTGSVLAACDDTLAEFGVRDDVLVIVNDNSLDSCEVGRYYAEKRGLGKKNIVHTFTRPRHLITYAEFLNFSDQIIKYMQDHTLVPGAPAAPVCKDGISDYYCQASVDHLRQYTKIRYLVPTRGVPSRTFLLTSESTTIDNYIAFSLLRYIPDDPIFNYQEREIAFGDGRGMRTVDPQHDGELIVGRIDGVSLQSSKRLIDRIVEAERNGIYGKLYGSWFGALGGVAQWLDYSKIGQDGVSNELVYGNALAGVEGNSWHYQLGMFGEARPQCIDYISSPIYSAEGKAPLECAVRFSEYAPGTSVSRTPSVADALIYLGSLHGQKSGGGNFDAVLNYVRNEGCSPKLCKNAVDQLDCRAASTDELKEINTNCVGVADGFIGYNFQSWPVASMALWPTGYMSGNNGGTNNDIVYPSVRRNIGLDDNYSLWFTNTDSIEKPLCYTSSHFTAPPINACRSGQIFDMYPVIAPVATQDFNALNPQTYRLRFFYKSNDIKNAAKINVKLRVRTAYQIHTWVDYETKKAVTINAGDTPWTEVVLDIPLDKEKQSGSNLSFNELQFRVFSTEFEGEIGIDKFSIHEITTNNLLTTNADFTEGHEQVSGGDHAAMFMHRLNAVGYWGSVSHYGSGGHSFDDNSQETVLYFLRGLPLGDAVWWGESRKSGIYYGDPLYSPVAVRFDYINDSDTSIKDSVVGMFELHGSTVNGRDSSRVTTTYAVDYCAGIDFYECDRSNSWLSTGLSGVGGVEDMSLGTWDATQIKTGRYVLRLSVTSSNALKGRSQTLHDYYPVMIYLASEDYDGDSLSNVEEITAGKDPANVYSPLGEGMNVYANDLFHQASSSFDSVDSMYILTWNQKLGPEVSNATYIVNGGSKKLFGNLTDLGDGRYGAVVSLRELGYVGNDVEVSTDLQVKNNKHEQQKIITVLSNGNFPPEINILSPDNESVLSAYDPITFSATANDEEEGDRSDFIEWTSNIDGYLGVGSEISRTLVSLDEHVIRATVTDAAGKTGFAERLVYLGSKPVALSVALAKSKGEFAIKLEWSDIDPARATTYVFRDGVRIAGLSTIDTGSGAGTGSYIDAMASIESGSRYSYVVCGGKSQCSPQVEITVD